MLAFWRFDLTLHKKAGWDSIHPAFLTLPLSILQKVELLDQQHFFCLGKVSRRNFVKIQSRRKF